MRWLDRRGLVGAMTAVHITRNDVSQSWHYHTHIIVELPAGTMTKREMLEKWKEIAPDSRVDFEEHQCRLAVTAGPKIEELAKDSGDADFWSEVPSQAAKAVQYPLRDLVQGVTAWRLGGDESQLRAVADELLRSATGWKLFRAWGRWRKNCPAAVAAAKGEAKEGEEGKGTPGSPTPLGTVLRVWRAARKGDEGARDALRRLERSCRNVSDFARRLVKFCRAGSDPGGLINAGTG
jgi:hypothetical protein